MTKNESGGSQSCKIGEIADEVYAVDPHNGYYFGGELLQRTIANAPPNELSIRRLRGGA